MITKSSKAGTELSRLESLVENFVKSTKELVESNTALVKSDHEKLDMVYEFLFVGRPRHEPPVPPFVEIVRRNVEDVKDFRNGLKRLAWMMVGILLAALGAFTIAIYNHVFLLPVIPQ